MAAWLVPALLAAQVTGGIRVVRVRVLDVRTRAAIPEVELFGLGGEFLVRGDSAGVLRVRIQPNASLDGQLRRVGYVSSTVRLTGREQGDSSVVMLASVTAHALDKVEVTTRVAVSRFADFDRRRLSGHSGIFLTDSQIVKGGHVRLTDLFRRFPSLNVIDSAGTTLVTSGRTKKVSLLAKPDLAPCVFQVIVDGVQVEWGFNMDQLNRDDIHGIEVYPGPATIPVEFASMRRDAMCGLIAIWTK